MAADEGVRLPLDEAGRQGRVRELLLQVLLA